MPNFSTSQAQELIQDAIENGTRHDGYQRTIALRDDYFTILFGFNWERFICRFPLRETIDDHRQKIALTHQNLSSTASLVEKKFGQISRIQDIKKGLNFEGTSKRDQQDLQDVLNDFGGEGSFQRGSLDDYLTLTYDQIALYDPNAFILYDFEPFNADAGERARPYGVLFTCQNVYNFRFTRGDLDYLLVATQVKYKNTDGIWQTVTDLICYAGPFAFRYYLDKQDGRADIPLTEDTFEATSGDLYRIVLFAPGIQRVPAVRLGYKPDPITGNLTCVSPAFHAALDLFKELIDLKAQNDIVSKKHGYPQQFKQSPPCPGEMNPETKFRDTCDNGINRRTNEICNACGGSGHLVHKSEQDTLIMDLPDNPEDWADLTKLVHTVKPELETITTYDDKIEKKKLEIVQTVFSSDQQIQVQGPSKTATEYTVSREDQNNTLLPFADHKSSVYKASVMHIAALMNISGEVKPLYEFPRDLKLTAMKDLYADMEAARKAGVGKEEISQIQDDINRKRYESDPVALQQSFIKKQHLPYISMALDEFEYNNASGLVPKDMAVLYANSDIVFGELEIERPDFYGLPFADRDALVSAKVKRLIDKLPKPVSLSGIPTAGSDKQTAMQQPAQSQFAVGDSVMPISGKEHMASHKGVTMTVTEIVPGENGGTYALKMPDGSIHKWYQGNELMSMTKST